MTHEKELLTYRDPLQSARFRVDPERYQIGRDRRYRSESARSVSVARCRTALRAAHILLTRPIKAGALKSWAVRLAGTRRHEEKAKVALARQLAVVLRRMWLDATAFDYQAEPLPRAPRYRKEEFTGFGEGHDTQAFPESGVPSPGRSIGFGPHVVPWHHDHASSVGRSIA